MIITGIDERSKNRSALSVDGIIRVWLSNDIIAEKGLRLGDEITEGELQSLIEYNDLSKAKNKAFDLLSYRDHSEAELRRKLSDRKFDEELIDSTVGRLRELGYLNDRRFAENLYRNLIFTKKYSKRRAVFELSKRGISKDFIEEAVEEVFVDDVETILSLLEGKYNAKTKTEEKRRSLSQALMRNGFGFGDIKSAFIRFDEENEDD